MLQRLEGDGQVALTWLAHQQVHMLGHDDVSEDDQLILLAHLLQRAQEEVAPPGVAQKGPAAVTTEGDEMEVTGAVVSLQVARHEGRIEGEGARRTVFFAMF